LDALRGTTAQRAARRQVARRPGEARAEERNVVRNALKDSLTALAQDGSRETHLKKLEATGLFDLEPRNRTAAARPAPGSGSLDARTATPETAEAGNTTTPPGTLSPAAQAEAARRAAQKALVHQLRGDDRDPQFGDAVELALQRGTVSLVLLSRQLRTSYARSRALLDRLVETDVVTRANEHGSHKVLLTPEFWAEVQALSGD
jgi:DNA segregation ATPase FtsK/SpoIIIE-like protein